MEETSILDWESVQESEKPASSLVSDINLLCDLGQVSLPLWALDATKVKDLLALTACSSSPKFSKQAKCKSVSHYQLVDY